MILKVKNKSFTDIKNRFQQKIDIDKTAVPNKVYFGKKQFEYFVGFKDAKKITRLFLPKMTA